MMHLCVELSPSLCPSVCLPAAGPSFPPRFVSFIFSQNFFILCRLSVSLNSPVCLSVSQLSVVLLQLAQFSLEPEIHFPLRLEVTTSINCSLLTRPGLSYSLLGSAGLRLSVLACVEGKLRG